MTLLKNSLALTIVYTIGHMLIAGTTVYVMTGSTLWEAGAVALVEPALNSVWFYHLVYLSSLFAYFSYHHYNLL